MSYQAASVYDFQRALAAALSARGFPYRVVYTPFLDSRTAYGSSIVVARGRGRNEEISAAIGPKRQPPSVLTRSLSAEVYVFAKSGKAGAHVGEHENECEIVVDGVLSAADAIVRGGGSPTFRVPEARYLTAEERSALGGFVEQWPGVVYFLRVVVPRAVARLTYQGEGLPEGEVGEVDTTVEVRAVVGATAETFEIAATGA